VEFKVDAVIKFHPTTKLRLCSTLTFTSPSGTRIDLSSTGDEELTIKMTLEADEDASAEERAQLELSRLCDILSYFHKVRITRSEIGRTLSERVTSEGKRVVTGKVSKAVSVGWSVVASVTLEPDSINKLTRELEKEQLPPFEDAIYSWREAISTESPVMRYLLLYRLLEFLFESKRDEVEDWIRTKEPVVPICHDRKGDTTIYTWLRDNIHRKRKRFPFEQMHTLLPRLEDLVKKAIEEKYT
jgi:hypothetical protein